MRRASSNAWHRGASRSAAPTCVAYLERFARRLPPRRSTAERRRLGTSAVTSPASTRARGFAGLDRRRHIEPYLSAVACATRQVDGAPITLEEQRSRIIAVHCFLNDIAQWGWPEAPARRLIFPRDPPRRPQPLPRYLPAEPTVASPCAGELFSDLAADALLLPGLPGCGSASCSTSSSTASTRSPGRAPG